MEQSSQTQAQTLTPRDEQHIPSNDPQKTWKQILEQWGQGPMTEGVYPPYQHPRPCPTCGHCPTCGKAPYSTQPYWYGTTTTYR